MSEEKFEVGYIGGDQFVTLDFSLIDSELIGGEEKILFAVLKRYKNKNSNKCWPSLDTLESKLGWSRKTVLKRLEILEEVGLIRKISSKSPKLNNKYILFDPRIVLGGKQLKIADLTEDEDEMLSEIDKSLIIEKNGSLMICASEKLAFYLQAIYKRLDLYAETIKETNSFVETQVIIDELRRFYESIASCPYVAVDKRITIDCDKIKSEDFFEKVKDFDFESIIEIVREINTNGLPKEFENLSKNSYILSYLWAKRETLKRATLLYKVEKVNSQL